MTVVAADICTGAPAESIAPPPPRRWLIDPWSDLLLIANVGWPLLLVLQWQDGFEGRAGLQFWQVYFVTTPHRWITLALVFGNPEQFRQRPLTFLGCLVGIVAACVFVRWSTGTLTCLLAIDYIWNAWHFAAQHQGIYRIYGRLTDAAAGWGVFIERWTLRLFLLYVTLRVAIATWSDSAWQPLLESTDWLVPVLPLGLLLRDCAHWRRVATGKILYLCSVSLLYLSLLGAVHVQRPALVLSLTTASALFHAVEYLSIVTWSVQQRDAAQRSNMGWLGVVASRWMLALGSYLTILGAGAWFLDQHWREQWLFLNVIAAFLHYTYDGLIWRRRPTTRRAQR